MSEATDAIIDIQEALEEYGSDIVLKSVTTEGTYNPATGETTDTVVTTNLKAIIKDFAGEELINDSIGVKDLKFMIYFASEIKYTDTITFDSKVYKILNIDKTILQNTNLLYIIQGRA